MSRTARFALLLVVLLVLAAMWRWTPLRDWLNVRSLIYFAHWLDAGPLTPAAVLFAYVVASLCVVPITVVIAVTGIVFGPLEGSLYAVAGSMLGAYVTYLAGERLGRDTVRRLAGARVNRLSQRIGQRGIAAMVILRLVPLAPFTVVNVAAGASHIGLRDYLLGTLIGMTPGIVLTVVFVRQVIEVFRNPTPVAILILTAITLLMLWGSWMLQQRLDGNDVGVNDDVGVANDETGPT
jgi:phospholipase D1/2